MSVNFSSDHVFIIRTLLTLVFVAYGWIMRILWESQKRLLDKQSDLSKELGSKMDKDSCETKQTIVFESINKKVDKDDCEAKQANCPIRISIEELSKTIDRLREDLLKRIGRLENIWIQKGGHVDHE